MDESLLVGVDFGDFIDAIKGLRFTEGQCEAWVARLDATHEPQRQLLFGTLHGIYCDPASPEPSRLNSLDLCAEYQPKFTTATKSDLIDRHSDYLAKGDTQRHSASQQFFENLGLLASLNEAERHSVISAAVRQLWNIHLGMINFYNEPPFAERLMRLSELEAIPETIQEQFVHNVVGCYIGNTYGDSLRASMEPTSLCLDSLCPAGIATGRIPPVLSVGENRSRVLTTAGALVSWYRGWSAPVDSITAFLLRRRHPASSNSPWKPAG